MSQPRFLILQRWSPYSLVSHRQFDAQCSAPCCCRKYGLNPNRIKLHELDLRSLWKPSIKSDEGVRWIIIISSSITKMCLNFWFSAKCITMACMNVTFSAWIFPLCKNLLGIHLSSTFPSTHVDFEWKRGCKPTWHCSNARTNTWSIGNIASNKY